MQQQHKPEYVAKSTFFVI